VIREVYEIISLKARLEINVHAPSQNHGIRYISALKLVEAKHIALLRDISGHKRHTVQIISMLHLYHMQPLMNVLHEIVEMDPSLRRHAGG
jgi:hypothetical protein